MRYLPYLLLLSGLCLACVPNEFRPCPSTHTHPTKQLYNEVLTQLIEQDLYLAYLPESDRAYIQQHFQDRQAARITPADSLWLRHQIALFQNRLFHDRARFQTFFLDTSRVKQYPRSYLAALPETDSGLANLPKIAALLARIAPEQKQTALARLNTNQQLMQARDFQLCTARLLPTGASRFPRPKKRPDEGVGIITLSEVVFNAARDQALLAYSWQCGGMCGYGRVALVEKVNGHWLIKQQEETWIS